MLKVVLGASGSAPLSILCLGAHCDDIEIGAGGTILRLLAERPGSKVHWVTLASTPEREREAQASATAFLRDAGERRVIVKSFRESYFPYVAADIKDFFEEIKRQVQPDVIFSHRREDAHQDHALVAQLTWNTFRNHLVLEYEIPKYEGDLGHPAFFVPLEKAVAARKVELILQHFPSQAQRAWFRAETFNGLMNVRGIECNAPDGCAEAFQVRKVVL